MNWINSLEGRVNGESDSRLKCAGHVLLAVGVEGRVVLLVDQVLLLLRAQVLDLVDKTVNRHLGAQVLEVKLATSKVAKSGRKSGEKGSKRNWNRFIREALGSDNYRGVKGASRSRKRKRVVRDELRRKS